jgi:hypothetical protein
VAAGVEGLPYVWCVVVPTIACLPAYCRNCTSFQDSEKRISFQRLPLVLCMHLKRFDHRSSTATATVGVKLDDFVEFPVRTPRMRCPWGSRLAAPSARLSVYVGVLALVKCRMLHLGCCMLPA